MICSDLREYIDRLEKEAELRRVKAQVDWHLEAGAVSRRVTELREPAPLFENIKDYAGHRMACVLMGPSKPALHARVAIGLGLDKSMPPLEMIEAVREKLKAPRKPVLVDKRDAPCKEVILHGGDANLLSFPIPWIKAVDGGRYVGTWDIVITRDPETGWVNWGTYRAMLKDERSYAIFLTTGQHAGVIWRKYETKKNPMPIALVIGADPLSHIAATTPLVLGSNEAEAAGALRGSPVSLVKCETSDLEVPATAEIVIEAETVPGERVAEGPFGEYSGHATHRGLAPLARVKCITHRRNPIFTMANMGKPWDDCHVPGTILTCAVAKNRLEEHGISIKACYSHPPMSLVISVNPRPGLVKKILAILMSGGRAGGPGIVFVDEDVDVTNLEEVWWAITTRMHPDRFDVIRGLSANLLIPYLPPAEREGRETSHWVMNATIPPEWPAEYREAHTRAVDFKTSWPEEVQRKVLSRWGEYGYDRPS